ncbi:uncharacterized protein LOC114258617 [Camellia sinensis]|uniref:uncharacterized protein LOC114258617 n=1 Tax=Camellia sinensis TaxID=4442 RepID=UPI001035955C|nr:uncharacterized protein LOC114258617 [Camellia sinensis]
MGGSNLAIPITIIAFITFSYYPIPCSSSPSSSIYEVLGSHGLPTGLLPKGITNFTIDPSTGHFEVRLPEACNAKYETDFHYDFNVSGTLCYGEIGQLSGVSAQDLFLWFPVKGVRVDVPSSGLIYFDVGVLRKQFSLSFFETPRDCTPGHPVSLVDLDFVFFADDARNRIVQNQPDNELGQESVSGAVSESGTVKTER